MLPEKFKERMSALLCEEYERFIAEYEKTPSRALHINRVKCESTAEGVSRLPFDVEKIDFCDDGFYFSFEKAGNLALHHAGLFYIQEPSAMCPVSSIKEYYKDGMDILDICASPGGKTSQGMNLAQEYGSVVFSNEIVPSRCKTLVGNAERLGFTSSCILNSDSRFLAESFRSHFGIVICDAPCSGEGMLRKTQAAYEEWSEENVRLCAERQREILDNAALCVADGGYLLYSTCTFSPEENELNASYFLKKHPDFSAVLPSENTRAHTSCGIEKYCDVFDRECARRFYPHISRGEGQFFVILKKDGTFEPQKYSWKDSSRALTKDEAKVAADFLRETIGTDELYLRAYGDNILILPEGFPVPSRHVFSCGVKLGEVRNSRLIPHHHFFSAYGKSFLRKVNLKSTDALCARYLHGEGFDYSISDGWVSVLVDGIPLGGAKAVGGYLKNHYPKGLRIN